MILGGHHRLMDVGASGGTIAGRSGAVVGRMVGWRRLVHVGSGSAGRISCGVSGRRALRHIPAGLRSGSSSSASPSSSSRWSVRLRVVVGVAQLGHIRVRVAAGGMAVGVVAGLCHMAVVRGRGAGGGGGLAVAVALVTAGIHNIAAVRQQESEHRPGDERDAPSTTGGHNGIQMPVLAKTLTNTYTYS